MTTAQEILALVEKLEVAGKRADRLVCDLASGKEKWNMCVPPQESDTDMVLIEPIRALPSLLAVVRELVGGMDEAADALEIAGDDLGNCFDNECLPTRDEVRQTKKSEQSAREALARAARVMGGER